MSPVLGKVYNGALILGKHAHLMLEISEPVYQKIWNLLLAIQHMPGHLLMVHCTAQGMKKMRRKKLWYSGLKLYQQVKSIISTTIKKKRFAKQRTESFGKCNISTIIYIYDFTIIPPIILIWDTRHMSKTMGKYVVWKGINFFWLLFMDSLFDIPKYSRGEDSIYFKKSQEFCGDGGWNFNRLKTILAPAYSNSITLKP